VSQSPKIELFPLCHTSIGCNRCRSKTEKGEQFRAKFGPQLTGSTGEWDCPFGKGPVGTDLPQETRRKFRGAGDVVAAITHAIGIEPCIPCMERQAAWNEALPYNSADLPTKGQ